MSVVLRTSAQLVNWTYDIPEQRTYIVLGAPRGGTSMTAGLLRIAGVHMGDDLDPGSNEDLDFLTHGGQVDKFASFDGGSIQKFTTARKSGTLIKNYKALIGKRNKEHDVWGWKDPISALYLDKIIKTVRNPFFIFVTRDISATALRERAEFVGDLDEDTKLSSFAFRKMALANSLYGYGLQFLVEQQAPSLLVSYERSLRYGEDLARAVLSFAGVEEGSDDFTAKLAEATDYISPDRVTGDITARDRAQAAKPTADNRILASLQEETQVTDIYAKAANLVNSGKYAEALDLSEQMLFLVHQGFSEVPHLATDAVIMADLSCAIQFVRSIAFMNLGQTHHALDALHIFLGNRDAAKARGVTLTVSDGLEDPALALRKNILADLPF